MILYTHRTDLGNPGDLWSCPVRYVDKTLQGPTIDLRALGSVKESVDTLIVGGGGLFYESKMTGYVQEYVNNCKPNNLIIWGVGSNTEVSNDLLSQADLVGVRQKYDDSTWDWLPCSSVLHPGINERRKVRSTKNFLIVENWKRKIINFPAVECTRINNNPMTIENILDSIVDHEYVITSSYHAWYWATLLNRKVVVCTDSTSIANKFTHLPYLTPVSETFSWDLLDCAKIHPQARDECSELNYNFIEQVKELIL
jgi:hypothetical protein